MDESTMIQISYDNRSGAIIDFTGGNLEVFSENKSIIINSGTSTIVVDGQARMEKNEEGFVLSVSEGQAKYDNMKMEAGSIIALDSRGEINTAPIISMVSFGPSAYILGIPTEATPVVFSWNSFFFNPDTYVIVEIAADRGFNLIMETRDIIGASSVSIPLESGNYWWRAYPANPGAREPANRFYPSGKLEVIPAVRTVLLSPQHMAELIFPAQSLVPLSWSAVEGASAYLLEISSRSDMSAPTVSRRVAENSITHAGLEFGTWYWRVTPVFPPHIRGSVYPSATGEFSLIQGRPILDTPLLTFPINDGKIYLDAAAGRLLWDFDPAASSWIVEMADNPAMNNPAVKQNAASNYFSLTPDLLRAGKTWYWRVTALGGEKPAVSDVWEFEVSVSGESAARPVLPPVNYRPIPQLPPVFFHANVENWGDMDAEIAASNDRILTHVIQLLETNREYRVRVQGFANPTINPADTEACEHEQVQELLPISEIRAMAIVEKLVSLGADRSRIEYRGLGGTPALAAWEDTENWWKNRRVELIILE